MPLTNPLFYRPPILHLLRLMPPQLRRPSRISASTMALPSWISASTTQPTQRNPRLEALSAHGGRPGILVPSAKKKRRRRLPTSVETTPGASAQRRRRRRLLALTLVQILDLPRTTILILTLQMMLPRPNLLTMPGDSVALARRIRKRKQE